LFIVCCAPPGRLVAVGSAGYASCLYAHSGLAPVLIMPCSQICASGARGNADLIERLKRLAERSGTRVSGVFSLRYEPADQGRQMRPHRHGRDAAHHPGDTLLAEFTPDEVESVIAHELGHQVHRDIPIGIVVSSFVTLIALFVVERGTQLGRRPWALAGRPIGGRLAAAGAGHGDLWPF